MPQVSTTLKQNTIEYHCVCVPLDGITVVLSNSSCFQGSAYISIPSGIYNLHLFAGVIQEDDLLRYHRRLRLQAQIFWVFPATAYARLNHHLWGAACFCNDFMAEAQLKTWWWGQHCPCFTYCCKDICVRKGQPQPATICYAPWWRNIKHLGDPGKDLKHWRYSLECALTLRFFFPFL